LWPDCDELPQVYLYLFQDGYGIAGNLTGYVLNTWGSMSWGAGLALRQLPANKKHG
jgi:hypothetical protein